MGKTILYDKFPSQHLVADFIDFFLRLWELLWACLEQLAVLYSFIDCIFYKHVSGDSYGFTASRVSC